jgi:AcrR family transcriptional regulator
VSSAETRVRRRQARDETRRQILDAAERLLRAGSFRELSVESLMAETGHSRTVFYRHFDDLADLVLAVLQDIGTELYEVSQRWISSLGEREAAVREGLSAIVDFFVRQGPLLRAVVEASHHDAEIERIYGGFLTLYRDLTAQALEREIAGGNIRRLDAAETARALTFMNEGYLLDSFGREPGADREQVLDALTAIWQRVLYGN